MRILSLEEAFPPELSSARIAFEFARELAIRGHDVRVITLFPRKHLTPEEINISKSKFFYFEIMDKVKILRFRPWLKSKNIINRIKENIILPFSLFIGGLLVVRRVDIIHCQSPPLLLSFTACFLSSFFRKPLVVRIQDIHPDALITIGLLKKRSVVTKILEFIEKFVYSKATHITVITEGYRQNFIRKGIRPEKVSLIPNWADVDNINLGQKNNNFSIKNSFINNFILTYAGTMSWPQDLETIVEAANILRDHKDILFLLIGDGVKKEILIKKTEEYGLQNICFMPLQPRDTYFQIIRTSDACFIPLKKNYHSPTLPSKILDIMACGKPVITNVPYASDVYLLVNKAKCGIWVEPENPQELKKAIIKIYNNRTLGKRLGNNGRRFLEENFSLKTCIDRYEQLLNTFVECD